MGIWRGWGLFARRSVLPELFQTHRGTQRHYGVHPSECWRDNSNACTLSNDGGQRWPLRRLSPPFKTHRFEINRLWSATILSDPMYREQFVTAEKTFETRP